MEWRKEERRAAFDDYISAKNRRATAREKFVGNEISRYLALGHVLRLSVLAA